MNKSPNGWTRIALLMKLKNMQYSGVYKVNDLIHDIVFHLEEEE